MVGAHVIPSDGVARPRSSPRPNEHLTMRAAMNVEDAAGVFLVLLPVA
jgi:hypothetical protein